MFKRSNCYWKLQLYNITILLKVPNSNVTNSAQTFSFVKISTSTLQKQDFSLSEEQSDMCIAMEEKLVLASSHRVFYSSITTLGTHTTIFLKFQICSTNELQWFEIKQCKLGPDVTVSDFKLKHHPLNPFHLVFFLGLVLIRACLLGRDDTVITRKLWNRKTTFRIKV